MTPQTTSDTKRGRKWFEDLFWRSMYLSAFSGLLEGGAPPEHYTPLTTLFTLVLLTGLVFDAAIWYFFSADFTELCCGLPVWLAVPIDLLTIAWLWSLGGPAQLAAGIIAATLTLYLLAHFERQAIHAHNNEEDIDAD
jgi:hypothetical protein